MARKYKFCANCRRTLTDSELQRSLYVDTDRGLLCATCAQRLDEIEETPETKPVEAKAEQAQPTDLEPAPQAVQPETDEGEPTSDDLRGIRQQLEVIRRSVMFEKSSTWNIVGAVAQCLALGMLLTAAFRWLDNPLNLLLIALLFQVMALTFFVKGK